MYILLNYLGPDLKSAIMSGRKESKTKGMLDKMVGFGGGNKRSKYPPGQLQRPSSVGK